MTAPPAAPQAAPPAASPKASTQAPDFGIAPSTRAKLARLFEAVPGIRQVWLFGSRARGSHRPASDIDLALELAPETGDSAAQVMAELSARIEREGLMYRVDLVSLQEPLDPALRAMIERDRLAFWAPRRHAAKAEALGAVGLKKFQSTALEALDGYLVELQRHAQQAVAAQTALRAMEGMDDLAREAGDFPKKAWAALKAAGKLPPDFAAQPHSSRFDGAGRAIPNVCLKVPTGGGKTLLATAAVARVFSAWFRRHTGLVLWVVPNEAIYRQTLKALSNRDHPYRQMLTVAGAGRVKILEKSSPLSRLDVESQLCVMLLMLPSAARQNKETLRFFRDRGNVLGFLPPEDDIEAHWAMLQAVPNLDAYGSPWQSSEAVRAQKGSIVKSSLGNVMRLLRPMVVLDESQRGYSDNALRTLDGFNPGFLLELSATPRLAAAGGTGSNILVDVRGTDLDEAEMIKLPIQVEVRRWSDWQSCLAAGVRQLDQLQAEAQLLEAETARYIRPILLVQVERTGADMRDAGYIHAEDAKAHLLQLGFTPAQIAVKTSDRDDLASPENIDLLSPRCEVRAIITKQALQEGWDCPFAYVLCALAAGRSPAAMTQLVGRILRLPQVAKTGRPALDACYVLCHDAGTAEVVKGIKRSLEQEGMGDLALTVVAEPGDAGQRLEVQQRRRPALAAWRIFLPRVTWVEGGRRRELVYDSDILARVDWQDLDTARLAAGWLPGSTLSHAGHLSLDLSLLTRYARPVADAVVSAPATWEPAAVVRALLDLVPNPWWLWDWVGQVADRLVTSGVPLHALAASASTLVERLRVDLEAERDRLAQAVFDAGVAEGCIEFRLRADKEDYELPQDQQLSLASPAQLLTRDGLHPIAKSLLEPAVRLPDLNSFEMAVAGYLDEQAALRWWHRNVAKTQFGLQGWKRHKVYPDFVFGMLRDDGVSRVVVLETKGLHLQGGDTAYKQALLQRLTDAFRDERFVSAGELALEGGREEVVCDLVFDEAWRAALDQRYFGKRLAASGTSSALADE